MSRAVEMHQEHVISSSDDEQLGQQAPGQAVTHYSPDVPCFIALSASCGDWQVDLSTSSINVVSSPSETGVGSKLVGLQAFRETFVVIDFGGSLNYLQGRALGYRDLSVGAEAAEAAACLFDTLRWAEGVPGAAAIVISAIPAVEGEGGLLLGIADRMFRSASGNLVHLSIK